MTFLTLLLTFTFVANLPLKFIKSSEETTILSFNNIKNGKNQLYNVNDIYEALDLQNYINNNMIKFKYLSKFINNFLISPNNSIDKSELSNDKNKLLRSNLWTELGLIVEDNQVAKINDVTFRKLNYSNNEIPQNWVKDFMSNKNRHYDLTLSFNKRFININELNKLILNEKDDDKKLILNDLYKFQEFINGYYTNLQSSFYSLFDDFIFFNDKQSKIDAKPGECSEQSNDCSADLKVEVLKANYVAMFANISNNNDILFNDSISNDLERFVKQTLNYPLMIAIRLLENYFVSYTTTYKKIINSQLDLNNEDYKKYNSTRNIFTYFTIFSPFYGLWSNYTYYSGYSFDDLWFNPYSDSKIDLYSQQNIFMPYVQYNFIIDNDGKILPNTYDYFISPSSYIIFYLIITYIAIACSYWKFKRISF
ncbi:transmembrane protein [Spiroplasma turonicum]|uniref:Transmembrane protein n=2 Tax=Spiroplasma turonicum TaxID=216946 RepID=A0A0K1P4Z9_9MOLU|nr:transmembrane protein [Spiroplasma turonicum]